MSCIIYLIHRLVTSGFVGFYWLVTLKENVPEGPILPPHKITPSDSRFASVVVLVVQLVVITLDSTGIAGV